MPLLPTTFLLLLKAILFEDKLPRRDNRLQSSFRQSFQNYFIGLALIALIMSLTITAAFLLLKVLFGLLFSLAIGTLVLFPLGGHSRQRE